VLQSCGKVFKRVYFNNVGTFYERYAEFAELLSQHLTAEISFEFEYCRNLQLVDLFAAKFAQMGVSFVNLNVRIEDTDSNSIPMIMDHLFTQGVKVLHFTGKHTKALNSRWEIIGPSLEQVKLVIGNVYGGMFGWNECFEQMKTHARNLTSISLKSPLGPGNDINDIEEAQLTDLFVSYGEQLLNLEIGSMSADSCAKIAHSCPNVQVSLQTAPNAFCGIPALAQNLRELHLRLNTYGNGFAFGGGMGGIPAFPHGFNGFNAANIINNNNNNMDGFDNAHETRLKEIMEKCFGLEKLKLSCSNYTSGGQADNAIIEAMLPIEMKCLKELTLCNVINPASFAHIASVTSRLKSIKFTCAFPIPTSAIDALARANRYLEVVEISEEHSWNGTRGTAETEEVVREIVHIFTKCTALRRIEVKLESLRGNLPSEKNLRQIVTPFRMKGVNFKFNFKHNARFFSTRIGRCKLEKKKSSRWQMY